MLTQIDIHIALRCVCARGCVRYLYRRQFPRRYGQHFFGLNNNIIMLLLVLGAATVVASLDHSRNAARTYVANDLLA